MRERWLGILPWAVGGAFVVILLVSTLARVGAGTLPASELWRSDFTNVWAAGKLVADGAYATLYESASFTRFQTELLGPLTPRIYSYPPTAFPIASAFAWLPYRPAFVLWSVLTGALFVYAARPWWPARVGPVWLALLMPASLWNLWIGHYGFIFGALWLLAFHHCERRPWLAGALIGLFVLKPQLAVLIPLLLLVRRDWRTIIASAVASVGYVALSVVFYGWSAWQVYFASTAGKQLALIDPQGAWFAKMSASAATAILDVGGGWTLALAVQAALAVLGIALVINAARRCANGRAVAMLAATVTFLVLPYSLTYDLTAVSVGALILMSDPRATPADRTLAAFGFMAPQTGIVLALAGLPITSLMIAGLAIAQYRGVIGRGGPVAAGAAH